jgi:CD109 antigen
MSKKLGVLSLILVIAILLPWLPACKPVVAATGYTAVIPAILQAGSKQTVSVNLFAGQAPAAGKVQLALLKDGKQIAQSQSNIKGNGEIQLNIPDVAEGEYTIQVKSDNFQDEAKVTIQNNYLVFLETDKPIYKPGQTMQIRTMTLDSGLKPTSENVVVEILDAKGIKIYRNEAKTDDFGMASLELPISQEPNLGTWKLTATTPKTKTQLDVRVEEYVLPKYEVNVDLPKDWFLVNEPIKGKVTAEYSFGKPVKGELHIVATKYVGTWQDFSTLDIDIDGEADFTITAANYVAGVPAAGGQGNVKLTFSVIEQSTGYQEKSDKLLTVAQSSLNLEIIPSGSTFKPKLPYSFMVVTKTPDNKLVESTVKATITYLDDKLQAVKTENKTINTVKGKAIIEINPPSNGVALTIQCNAEGAQAYKAIESAYSPTSNFIHLEQTSEGTPQVGNTIKFWVYSTKEATNFYYEVLSRGQVVFSDFTKGHEISFQTTPDMAPSAKLLVYQILPNAEVAADYLPFEVTAEYPQNVQISTSTTEAKPGDEISINIQTEGQAEVGLVAVDKSVFILAENRMNLQQVFDELEKLYMNPQAEIHEVNIYEGIDIRGAQDVFKDAGVIVLSNNKIPAGKEIKSQMMMEDGVIWGRNEALAGGKALPQGAQAPMVTPSPTSLSGLQHGPGQDLAEVQRVRQFFPETWIWDTIKTASNGKGSVKVTVPDTITTWMLRAVALSKNNGLGIAESQLKVFQPFFLTVDLPYSVVRSEEFPVKVAVYNYLDQPQNINIQIESADWFQLLDESAKSITLAANEIGSAEFKIKPVQLGTNGVKISARSPQAADAVIKTVIVEAEGVPQEMVDNLSLSNGKSLRVNTAVPDLAIEGSARAYLAVTSSFLAQTIDGLESLLQMPFGCGEQNMIVFAPDVYITKYLQESGQLKPEIMAKAEKLMLTGYQRELTYMRQDGSFSAFGENDKEGSLWLTAFVLKCFSEAKGLIYIDDDILNQAKSWILSHQNTDGSFDSVGFVHHQEMLGGLKGKTALTAYVAIALLKAGDTAGASKAINYLESQLDETEDAYAVALLTYALELANSPEKDKAYDKLMKLAKEDENGLYWGDDPIVQPSESSNPGLKMMPIRPEAQTSGIETTGYATLALINHGDALNASRAAKWLVSKRNAHGGYSSTQDTVVALQALIEQASGARADVDLTVEVKSASKTKEVKIQSSNFDILQIVEIPVNEDIDISVTGKGEAIAQVVRRFNLPDTDQTPEDILKIDVNYDSNEVEVNDQVKVSVEVTFNPPEPIEAGMTVLDIAVPTGFSAVKESIEKVVSQQPKIKRYDISGRKVIFYIENLLPGDTVSFDFRVQALYPVKAKGVTSQAYSYYQPEISSESLSEDITIVSR